MSDQLDNIFTETQVVSLVEIRGMNRALMHLQRMLLTGATALREDRVPVRVEAHSERLLAVKRGEMAWPEVDSWRKELHGDFECALAETKLPERPDYEAANGFLIKARWEMASQR